MSDRDKLIELTQQACIAAAGECDKHLSCEECPTFDYAKDGKCKIALIADHLIANGVTLQITPISYERLLHIARQMHLWIFLHCADEQKAYDELKITEEENVVFGYDGKLEITIPEPLKGE